MSDNPFRDVPNSNPYASPPPLELPPGNPLLVPAVFLLVFASLFLLLIVMSLPGQIMRMRDIDTSTPRGAGELTGGIVSLVVWSLMNIAVVTGALSMIRL